VVITQLIMTYTFVSQRLSDALQS